MKILNRLRVLVCAVLAIVLAVNCVPAKGSDTVHADKYAQNAIAWGIDVSAWQGNIDWNAVKASGVQFAFIKCGGTIYGYDEKFFQNMAGAQAAGIKTGVYIYSYASSVQDGIIEAQWIINAIEPYSINMPVVLDLENYRQKALDPLTNAMICQVFCQTVEAAGYYPMVYSNRSMFRSTIGPFGYDRWVAQWYNCCTDDGAAFWQATDSGSIPGIRGHVDIDYQFKDLSQYIVPYGFVSRDGYVYYYENYRRQSNRFVNVNGGTYYVDAFGHLIAGALYPIGDFIYYFDPTGLMQVGFVNLGDGLRYFDENGHMVAGWQNILGNMYFFDVTGLMQTGFISDGVFTYYLDPATGVMQTGMFNTPGGIFYADTAGHILTGMQNIAGNTYFFDPVTGGAMKTGFVSDGINTYYFDPVLGGALRKGLFANGNNLYYADANGKLQTGLVSMSGLSFYFDPLKGGALLVNGTATDAAGHVYIADANGLAMMVK